LKRLFIILLCLSTSHFLVAQETVKRKEIGLAFSSFDSFGLTFRTGTDKSLWRFNTLFISGGKIDQIRDSSANKSTHGGFHIQIGKEYRKAIVEDLQLRLGVDISFSYSKAKSYSDVSSYNRSTEQTTYIPGINLVFGLNYFLNDKFMIGAELLPNFSYTTGTSVEKNSLATFKSDMSGFSYGISNNSALLSLAYRF
jgi:hypothetical protein